MKIYYNLQNRQSGKSQRLIYEFLKDPENTIVLSRTEKCAKHLWKRMGMNKYKIRFISALSHNSKSKFKDVKRILIDEYSIYKHKVKKEIDYVRQILEMYVGEEIILFSTPNKIYNHNLILLIKQCKSYNYSYNESERFLSKTFEFNRDDILEYWYDLITSPQTIIINNEALNNYENYFHKTGRDYLDAIKIKTELKGEYI